jgi:hypothetical protein
MILQIVGFVFRYVNNVVMPTHLEIQIVVNYVTQCRVVSVFPNTK